MPATGGVGGQEHVVRALQRESADDAKRYLQALPQAKAVTFDDAGHELWRPDAHRYLDVLRAFLDELDTADSA
ncbi:MAG: hypothetical protein ACYDCQ_05285 [Dehalococcoidia bacterium]